LPVDAIAHISDVDTRRLVYNNVRVSVLETIDNKDLEIES